MKTKAEGALETITDLSVNLDFTKISNGKEFHRQACEFMGERCGRSTFKVKNKDEDFWYGEAKRGREIPYNSTPAAKRRRAEKMSESVTPVADPPRRGRRY